MITVKQCRTPSASKMNESSRVLSNLSYFTPSPTFVLLFFCTLFNNLQMKIQYYCIFFNLSDSLFSLYHNFMIHSCRVAGLENFSPNLHFVIVVVEDFFLENKNTRSSYFSLLKFLLNFFYPPKNFP